ncbi:MAG: serine/threonine protein kinase [Verrucomicrobiota bacterium]
MVETSTHDTPFAWGDQETQHFFDLTPDRILEAVEAANIRCTGRCMPLNSMENRVYEVEIELAEPAPPDNPSEAFRIVKFYRPGRWSREQIHGEHQFLIDLEKEEIPVVAPLPFSNGETVRFMPEYHIWYTVFPRVGGRNPDELTDEQLSQIGRLLARIHIVGARSEAHSRIKIGPESYGLQSLDYLLDEGWIEADLEDHYSDLVEEICELTQPWFDSADYQRIHGDAHLGNLLYGRQGFFWVDFDDMVQGPAIQDIWLLTPGRDEYSNRQRNILLESYEMLKTFDYGSLRLTEPLRALRYIHFCAWIGKRWEDPSFPPKFPEFGTRSFWQEQIVDLEECLRMIKEKS